ncbi:hypothetical protein [Bradyrhizobium liaoningense]|uniref:hypothetical protein n=1 Tax=Bradyrhizobium liaoningense TaxID=43992 RepID=UPI00289F1382|nr:hypothetical protein [Bradyrhizobium liaoningense]
MAVELPHFDPKTSTKQFTLAANDFTTMVLCAPRLKLLEASAPSVDLTIKPVTRIDLAEQIDLGRIDVAIGVFSAHPRRFKTALMFEDTGLAAIVPRPLAKAFERRYAIRTHELPYATTPVEIRLLWHERVDDEPSHAWLHDILRRSAESPRHEIG